VAKGAMLTHRNMVANMQQASAWIDALATPGKEVIVTALPLYHIFALTANGLVFMKYGAKNILITNPRDMPGFVKELKREPFTAITGVNTLFNGLLNTPGFDEVDFSHLRLTLGGGMAVQRSVAERWKKTTGVTLVEAYGLTETAPAACINPMDLKDYNGSIGLPIPSTDACVKGEDGAMLSASCASAARRSWRATGNGRTKPRRPSTPRAGCIRATWRRWTRTASSISSTARRT